MTGRSGKPASYSEFETRIIDWARQIHRIDAALKRIDSKEYGYCLRCGSAIGHDQLEQDPAATHCPACTEVTPQS